MLTAESKIVDKSITVNDVVNTAIAFLIDFSDICLLNTSTVLLFLITETAEANKTRNVTVFIPPAVPTGEPPMNINSSEITAEEFVKSSCGIVANPAVLVVTD